MYIVVGLEGQSEPSELSVGIEYSVRKWIIFARVRRRGVSSFISILVATRCAAIGGDQQPN